MFYINDNTIQGLRFPQGRTYCVMLYEKKARAEFKVVMQER